MGGKLFAKKAIVAWLGGFPASSVPTLCEGVNLPEWMVLPLLEELEEEGIVYEVQE